ncbi:MAG TPA: hypothetical protein VM901_01415 [Bdellovibrionota bacterium]|jgi:hypothetical protein|nr:hypothetical protein [Bdellovibrionota bacterium]
MKSLLMSLAALVLASSAFAATPIANEVYKGLLCGKAGDFTPPAAFHQAIRSHATLLSRMPGCDEATFALPGQLAEKMDQYCHNELKTQGPTEMSLALAQRCIAFCETEKGVSEGQKKSCVALCNITHARMNAQLAAFSMGFQRAQDSAAQPAGATAKTPTH